MTTRLDRVRSMPEVHVCSLSRLAATVAASGASHMVSLINAGTPVSRPATIPAERHLFLGFNDIVEPADGLTPPAAEHVEQLLAFVGRWDRSEPIVMHCWAGISRSTAAAFVTLCALAPDRSEMEIARRLRESSRFATPNARIVAIADVLLDRDQRMVTAIEAIGRGHETAEGEPFSLRIDG